MFYEVKVRISGKDKDETKHYILDNVDSFAEAELKTSEFLSDFKCEFDVFSICRSKIIEIVNKKEDDKPFFKATITSVEIDDNGKEKEKKYYNLVCAKDVREANMLMEQHLSQCLSDMRLDGISKTKILDLLE